MKKTSGFFRLSIYGMLTIILLSFLVGCKNQKVIGSEIQILTVNDSKVYLDEMMYHLMVAEIQGEMYASLLGSLDTYWSTLDKNGVPIAETAKKDVMNNVINYEILYEMAMNEGYVLDDEEVVLSNGKVENILKNIPKEQLDSKNLTDEKLLDIQYKIALCTKYYNDYINTLDVNEDEIKKLYDMKEYKQYNIQYVFANTKIVENPETVYLELSSILEDAKVAEDITIISKPATLTAGTLSFVENEEIFGEEYILEDTIRKMQVGEVSDIIETVNGYYIIKLIDNTSREKYEETIKQAIENARTDAFEESFNKIKKKYSIKINNHVWDEIQLGNITL